MISFGKTFKSPLNNRKGFTLIELLMVIATISTLSSIAMANFYHMKQRAYDATARTDARNLVENIINAALDETDVDYSMFNASGAVGIADTAGNPRAPIFRLSKGVAVRIAQLPGNDLVVQADVYHVAGTPDGSLSGRREFSCIVDEANDVVMLP